MLLIKPSSNKFPKQTGKFIVARLEQIIGNYFATDHISNLAQFLVLSIFTHHETKESLNER